MRPEPDGELELYNLRGDPAEGNNVAAAQPEVMAKIESYLKTARTQPRPQRQPQAWLVEIAVGAVSAAT